MVGKAISTSSQSLLESLQVNPPLLVQVSLDWSLGATWTPDSESSILGHRKLCFLSPPSPPRAGGQSPSTRGRKMFRLCATRSLWSLLYLAMQTKMNGRGCVPTLHRWTLKPEFYIIFTCQETIFFTDFLIFFDHSQKQRMGRIWPPGCDLLAPALEDDGPRPQVFWGQRSEPQHTAQPSLGNCPHKSHSNVIRLITDQGNTGPLFPHGRLGKRGKIHVVFFFNLLLHFSFPPKTR